MPHTDGWQFPTPWIQRNPAGFSEHRMVVQAGLNPHCLLAWAAGSALSIPPMDFLWHGGVTGNIPMDNYLYLYNSSDGGSTWSAQSGPIPTDFGTVFTNTYPPVFFDQKGIMPVTLFSNVINLVIYTSNNGGETWTAAPAPVANAGRGELVDFVNPTDGFAWATGRFAVTHDAAQNWDTVTPSIPFGDNFMAMDFVNTSTGWVLTMNADSHTSLYQTTDGGTNWITLIP
jgi:hypothetical protein